MRKLGGVPLEVEMGVDVELGEEFTDAEEAAVVEVFSEGELWDREILLNFLQRSNCSVLCLVQLYDKAAAEIYAVYVDFTPPVGCDTHSNNVNVVDQVNESI